MHAAEEILRLIQQSRERIRRYGVKRIALSGSYLRGEQRGTLDKENSFV